MSESIHNMTTRSKNKLNESSSPLKQNKPDDLDDEVDEYGNLKDFIDYDCDESFDKKELDKQVKKLSGRKKFNKKDKKDKKDKKSKINDILMSYLILKATDKSNDILKKKRRNKSKKINIIEEKKEKISLDNTTHKNKPIVIDFIHQELPNTDSDDESFTSCETPEDIGSPELESDTLTDKESKSDSVSEEEYSYEYDNLDEKYEELIDKQMNQNSEESNMEFYHYLSKEKKESYLQKTKEIYEFNGSNKPLRFKIIESDMDMKTKAIALENIDKMAEMDVSTGEYSKMDHWINGLMRIPFGKYNQIPIQPEQSIEEKKNYIQSTYKTLNKAIYGHKEAKTHILQVIGKWIRNPNSGGNVLAIQGPMGNGKTTLVKEGISKVLNRPFAFIALGGASDSAFFDGHCFTYEGSHWGRIIQILHDSKCMNPVIYFDELDKISETPKGDEIVHMLTHLTDPSQNSLFQDNYFPGINLDLSKALFIFSYNDESRVNKILKDRMYVIHTKGFNIEDKLKISREYLIPEIFNTFMFEQNEIIFTDDILKNIIQNYTQNEEGVRNLKRCIETIISKINIHVLSEGDKDLSFQLENFNLPIELNRDHIEILLKSNQTNNIPFGMYN